MTCASRGAEVRSRRVPLDTDPSSDSEIMTSEPTTRIWPSATDMAVRNRPHADMTDSDVHCRGAA